MNAIRIKPDKRYRVGHIVMKNGVLRGHPESVSLNYYAIKPIYDATTTYIDAMKFALAPPIFISSELAKAIKENV